MHKAQYIESVVAQSISADARYLLTGKLILPLFMDPCGRLILVYSPNWLVDRCFTTNGQETERVYSFNPGDRQFLNARLDTA